MPFPNICILHSESLHLHSYLNTITPVHNAGTEPTTKKRIFHMWGNVALHCTKWGGVIVVSGNSCSSSNCNSCSSSSSSSLGIAEAMSIVSVVVHLPQLHHNILHVCSILPFLFYCPFICIHCKSLKHHQPPVCCLWRVSFSFLHGSVSH